MTSTLSLQRRLKAAGFSPGPLDGVWGPSTLKAVNAALDGHIPAAGARAAGVKLPPAPPPEFDGEPDFDYKILTVSPALVREYCRGIENACAIPKRRVIVISDRLKGATREAFLRHEKGHLRGWLDCRETILSDDHDEGHGA